MDPKSIDYIIYHAECSDGFGAAWAAWKLLGNRATYYPAKHGLPPPDVRGKHVAILDFCYSKKTTEEMIEASENLIVIDHHKSAMIKLEDVHGMVFDMTHSGCVLAWNFFHPGVKPPKFLTYIEDRDLNEWDLEYSREFSAAFDMTPFQFEDYDKMLFDSSVDDCKRRGAHLLPYTEQVISKACTQAAKRQLGDHEVLITNASHWISEIAMRLATQCDIGMVWKWDHVLGKAIVSLRSAHDDVDCSIIAKKFGGGGHPKSAGFEFAGNIEDIFLGSKR